jgi:hypothetical protein
MNRNNKLIKWGRGNSKRNQPCLCGSGKKFKECCLPGYQRRIHDLYHNSRSKAKIEKENKPKRVYLSVDNQGEIYDLIEESYDIMLEKLNQIKPSREGGLMFGNATPLKTVLKDIAEKGAEFYVVPKEEAINIGARIKEAIRTQPSLEGVRRRMLLHTLDMVNNHSPRRNGVIVTNA